MTQTKIDPRDTLADFIVASKYARHRADLGRRETYDEAIDRVMAMHRRKFGPDFTDDLAQIEQALKDRRILGSQRNLQFAGPGVERINLRGYNCSFSYADRSHFFAEALWLLLCGCGVGFSVQKHHVAKLDPLFQPHDGTHRTHRVRDSIEGWADALDDLMRSYFKHGHREIVYFDYSEIRLEGSPISTSSGKAPGPKPLRDSLESIRSILNRVERTTGRLRPIDVYDIVMEAASCVRAGGIRRSATICLFSPDDEEMTKAKIGEWLKTHPNRRLSNNSALLLRNAPESKAYFERLIQSTREMGEPGFSFTDDLEYGTNPCHEISLYPTYHLPDGSKVTGWAFCNLTSVNIAACDSPSDFHEACVAAAKLGTFQAAYQDTSYLGEVTRRIMDRDALLGVSLTGFADRPEIGFDGLTLETGAVDAVRANQHLAARLGIRAAARVTTVKPEGTGSLVVKAGNGIHPHHARRYLRYAEGGKMTDPVVAFMAKHIPEAVVPSAYAADEYKVVFPIDLGDGYLWTKDRTNPLSHLEKVKLVQQAWVNNGTVRGKTNHYVSNTVVVKPDEWDSVKDWIWANRADIGGISLIGSSGDLDYAQAPFVEVLDDDQMHEKYGHDPERLAKAKEAAALWHRLREVWVAVDFSQMTESEDGTRPLDEVACAGGACLI